MSMKLRQLIDENNADIEAWLARRSGDEFARGAVAMVTAPGEGIRKPKGEMLACADWLIRMSTVNALMQHAHRKRRLAVLSHVAIGIAIGSGLVLAALMPS